MGRDSNIHFISGESFSVFVTSIGKIVSASGLTDSLNVFDLGVSLFFFGMSEINFLISSGIIAKLRYLL